MNHIKINIKRLLTIILLIVLIIEILIFIKSNSIKSNLNQFTANINNRSNSKEINDIQMSQDLIDFEGFDHINGAPEPIIPNIVHLLYLLLVIEIYFFLKLNPIYSDNNKLPLPSLL